jgi:hypothetical protein
MDLFSKYNRLISAVSEIQDVLSIGKSGGEKLPAKNEGDVDIFIFCNKVPDVASRQVAVSESGAVASYIKISEADCRFWGVCDFIVISGIEICLMYFSITDIKNEIDSVLNGSRLDRESEYFYPTGRCAAFLTMHILFDKYGYIANMKEKLSVYPPALSKKFV